jgi:hypothetical protein
MPTVKEKKPATAPTVAPAAPVDPSQVLAERKRRRQAAAWNEARALLVKPELTEPDILRLADALETAGLATGWLQVFRATLALHAAATAAATHIDDLMQAEQAASAAATAKAEELKRETERLEKEAQEMKNAALQANFDARQARGQQQLAAELAAMFRPLFDPAAGLDGFALPLRADQLPAPVYGELASGGLIQNGQPAALTAPQQERQPRPKAAPVLRCSVGPVMTAERPPAQSVGMTLNGQPVERV